LKERLGILNFRNTGQFFLTTLVFDAIIGNTDRHQENWAFIGSAYSHPNTNSIQEEMIEKLLTESDPNKFKRMLKEYRLRMINLKRMAPIYDSGSSLAREINGERVIQLLQDESELRKYINRGNAEVHWQNQKKSHFDLLENILTTEHADTLRTSASFLHNWIQHDVEQLISHIDDCMLDKHAEYKIPLERKNLMVKLLTLRHRRVVDIIYG